MSAPGSKSQQMVSVPAPAPIEIRLNWELPPWMPSFRANLATLFAAQAPVSFRPGIFWKDVFVDQKLNWKSIARSYAGHIIFAGMVYVLSMPFYWQRFAAIENFHHDRLTYLNPDDVLISEAVKEEFSPRKLEPVISRSSKAPQATPGAARRRIAEAMAIPKWADNSTHTIVAPTAPKILASSPIPDIVLSTAVPQAPPVAAVASNTPKLIAPMLEVTPVAPPPDVSQAKLNMPSLPQAAAIAPPVQTNGSRNLANLNIVPLPQAVNPEPKLTVVASHTMPGLGTVEPIAPAPDLKTASPRQITRRLPAAVQPIAPPPDVRTVADASGVQGKLPGTADPIAPPPDVNGAGSAATASGALISLNLNPIAGAPRLPDGSRRGAFAGHPEAALNSAGAPARQAGGSGPGGDSPVATKDELGIVAAAVPHGAANGAPATTAQALAPGSGGSLLAMARAPRISLPPPRVATITNEPNALDERVFHGRKYYTMALNKPNLTSAAGSWIFRFAERGVAAKAGEVTAPVPLREVDAAYPADLIRDNIQGVVILYAVIRTDGSVAEVKILEGFDDRLDENARVALTGWHFVPGTRDGNPVDIEAVVRIPFRSKRGF